MHDIPDLACMFHPRGLFLDYGNCDVHYAVRRAVALYAMRSRRRCHSTTGRDALCGGLQDGIDQKCTLFPVKSEGSDSCSYPTLRFWTFVDGSMDFGRGVRQLPLSYPHFWLLIGRSMVFAHTREVVPEFQLRSCLPARLAIRCASPQRLRRNRLLPVRATPIWLPRRARSHKLVENAHCVTALVAALHAMVTTLVEVRFGPEALPGRGLLGIGRCIS